MFIGLMNKILINYTILTILLLVAGSNMTWASDVNAIAQNMVLNSDRLPSLLSAFAYLLGLLIGVTAILKLKEHVENPTQTPIRVAIIRLFVGGALFALPIVFEAASTSYGNQAAFTQNTKIAEAFKGIPGLLGISTITAASIDGVLSQIINSISSLPSLLAAIAYLVGLLSVVAGVLKVKEHVENPEQTPLREAVIRLAFGGALFSLPTIYSSLESLIYGDGTNVATILSGLKPTLLMFSSDFAPTAIDSCDAVMTANTGSFGSAICQFIGMGGGINSFLNALAYLMGLVVGLWALFKIRDHVLNPQQTSIWEGVSRIIVASLFLTFPYVAEAIRESTTTGGNVFASIASLITGYEHETYIAGACSTAGSLDTVMACAMRDVIAPVQSLLNYFAYVAGAVFILIGISRLMKSTQDGPRGPSGMGTWVTFIIGGLLLSYNSLLHSFSTSMFDASIKTKAALNYTSGMTQAEEQHVEVVIQSVLQFMILVGLISFVRGWFIVRDVAEGNQQASMMAGVTHIIGGALAVNLGPLLNAIQQTLGLGTTLGISFT